MMTKLDHAERDIQKTRSKIAEFQRQLRELETQKTKRKNLQIIQPVYGMDMEPGEFAAFSRSSAMQAAPAAIPYREQEGNAHKE